MAIKNIIFDMGGVLVEFNPENMIRRCSLSDYKDEIMTALFKSEEWKKMDSGDLSVDEALEIMTDRLAPQIREKAKVMVLDRENYMPPLKGTTPIINALHQNGYRLFVLSNCPAWFHSFKKSIPSIELFEGFVVSVRFIGFLVSYTAVVCDQSLSLFLEKSTFIRSAPQSASTVVEEPLSY